MIIGMVNLIRMTAQKKKTHAYFVDYSRKIFLQFRIVFILMNKKFLMIVRIVVDKNEHFCYTVNI